MWYKVLDRGLVLFMFFLVWGCATQQQTVKDQKDKSQKVGRQVPANWHIDIRTMFTTRYGTHNVTTDFFLEMRNDTLRSYLPYAGRVFRPVIGETSSSLDFEKQVTNFSVTYPKTDKTRIEMDVHLPYESFHYTVDLYSDGGAYIGVRSPDRDPVNFDGDFSEGLLDEDK